jgi:HEAT repeat protein
MMWPFKSWRPPQELLSCLEDSDPEVSREAFNELALHPDQETDVVILATLQTLKDPPVQLLRYLIELIGKRGIEAGVPALKKFTHTDDPDLRIAVLRALIKVPIQASLDAIIPALADEDLTIRREVRVAISGVFGDRAMGALMRCVPEDTESSLYFEIVSLFEEMGFFEKLIENFRHPDIEVRKFHLTGMVKFHYPDFIPLYLDALDLDEKGLHEKIRHALLGYSMEELLPSVLEHIPENPSRKLFIIIEEILINRFPESREKLIPKALLIDKTDLRLEFVERLLRKPDTLAFVPALALLEDPAPQIRSFAADSLIKLIGSVKFRLSDQEEVNRDYLRNQFFAWGREVAERLQKVSQNDVFVPMAKVFLHLAQDRSQLLLPLLPKLLTQQFNLTVKHLGTWGSDAMESLLSEILKHDRSIGGTLVSGVMQDSSPDLVKVIMKNLEFFDKKDVQLFRKTFNAKLLTGKYPNFYDDPDPLVRCAALELMMENGNDSYARRVEEKCHDPDPVVRQKALEIAQKTRHPKTADFLEEACFDPSPIVALEALKAVKKVMVPERFAVILTRAVNNPNEEIKTHALREIAKVTQKRYLENFNSLPPSVRKLAGSAILKLDASFIDHIIGDLRSLDPASRLRAAMIMENLQVGEKAKEALLAGIKDPSKKVRAAIVKTLGIMGDKTLMTNLIECFNDPDERVRANAIEAISAIGDDRAVKMLLPFLDDSNNRIRANAALAVWQIGKVNILPVLTNMIATRETLMKASALWVLGEIRSEVYLSMIIPFIGDREEIVRANAVKALAKIKPEVLKPYLPNLRKDSSQEIKKIVADLSYKLI